MLPAYPFDLTAQGTCLLDEKTAAALSAGEATLRETYAWAYEPAEALLPPESLGSREGSWGRFPYREKFAGSRQQIAVTYTVAITWLKEDRPPEEYAATDTLDVLVMYSGGGRILEGGAAELYLYPPAQNGQTCDMITVYAKVYTPYVFGDLQMRGGGGQWYSMNPMLVESTPQYTLWCSGWSTADVPDLKNTWVDWRVVYWDYYQWPPVQYTEEESWYRYNTVVHCPAEKVLKWDPYDEGNCDTNAEFTLDHLNYGDPDWTVTVKIYDACGALIRTLVQEGGFQVGENSVEWDGSLEPPPYGPGGTAPKGLYTYTVEAVHTEGSPYWPNEMCKDKDKSRFTEITGTQISGWQVDPVQRKIEMRVSYTVSGYAGASVWLKVFGPGFEQLHQETGLSGSTGSHQTDWFEVDLPEGEGAYGGYTVVIYALENSEAAAQNRDGQAKYVRQGAAARYYLKIDITEPDFEPESDNHFVFDTAPHPYASCEVIASGTCHEPAYDYLLYWQITAMQGSTLSSAPDPPAGPEIEFTYTTLPAANAHLGPKTLTLTHGLVPDEDTQEVEIFFAKYAKNHPGPETGVAPNWYFYWGQTSADYGTHSYSDEAGSGYCDFVNGQWTAFICSQGGDTSACHTWDWAEGIDFFANICRHEEQHRLDLSDLWGAGNNRDPARDLDGDWLPDELEPSLIPGHPYDPTRRCTYFDVFHYNDDWLPDVEDYCLRREAAWANGSANGQDWASPGKQYGG